MQRATVARWTWGWLSSGQQVRTDESKHSCWLLVVLNRRQVNETRVFPCFRKCTFDVKQEIEEDEGREMCRRTKRTMYTCDCVVLSYDSYLLTTEKPFLLFRRVSSVLSFLPLLLSLLLARLCVSSFIFSCERERKRTSIVRLLARICCCLSFSLSLPVRLSSTHYYLDSTQPLPYIVFFSSSSSIFSSVSRPNSFSNKLLEEAPNYTRRLSYVQSQVTSVHRISNKVEETIG